MDDYISKQAAMDCMMDCQHDFRDGCVWIPRHEAVTRLEKMQSTDVQPVRHGKWIEANDVIISGTCSVCGWDSCICENDVVGMPYCPNCGARMVEGSQND